jgi:peptide deformylase
MEIADDKPRVFINPQIVSTGLETGPFEEGCLSIPGLWAEVTRPLEISVQAFDLKGKPFRIDADGYLARVIQHEIDHLNGVLFVDRLPEKKRARALDLYMKKMRA